MPLSAVRDLVRRVLGSPPEPEELPPPPRRVVEHSGLFVHPKQLAAFLAATGGERIARFHGEGAVVSPAFPTLWEGACIEDLLFEAGNRLPGGCLRLECRESLHLRPLYLADRVRCRVELQAIERLSGGTRFTIESRAWNAAGQLCSRGATVCILSQQQAVFPRQGGTEDSGPGVSWQEVARWKLRGSRGRRYAKAGGGLHLIRPAQSAARLISRRRSVLQGGCLEALITHALIERQLHGDPTVLRRLRIVFHTPVRLPAQLRLQVAEGEGEWWFRITGRGEPLEIHADGTFAGG